MSNVDNVAAILASIAGALAVLIPTVPRIYSRLRRNNQIDGTEADTLRMLDAAVLHWRGLYDTAWAQVAKERELREAAEQRAATIWLEVEKLRGEVAALRREIEHLSATVRHYQETAA